MSNYESVQDVFISYAHADDDILRGAEAGWVTTFVDELKKLLHRKLGGSGASIWMDHQLTANDQVTATLMESVTRSRTLVLFMSPGYSMSDWCQKELGRFLEINSANSIRRQENVGILDFRNLPLYVFGEKAGIIYHSFWDTRFPILIRTILIG